MRSNVISNIVIEKSLTETPVWLSMDVAQRSVIGSLPFSIYTCDLCVFEFCRDIDDVIVMVNRVLATIENACI